MKMRKFLHISAIMLSSLGSTISHAKAQETTTTGKEKKGEGELARHHRHHNGASTRASHLASDDPHARAKTRTAIALDDIKNSKHAATWTSYMEQESAGAPAPPPALKLDPALMASAERPMAPLVSSSIAPGPLPGDEQSRYP